MDKNAISYFQESITYDILKEESFFLNNFTENIYQFFSNEKTE